MNSSIQLSLFLGVIPAKQRSSKHHAMSKCKSFSLTVEILAGAAGPLIEVKLLVMRDVILWALLN